MASASDLQDDIAAARAAGIRVDQIAVYSLEGLDEHADPEAWVQVPAPVAAEIDSSTEEIRSIFGALDALGS